MKSCKGDPDDTTRMRWVSLILLIMLLSFPSAFPACVYVSLNFFNRHQRPLWLNSTRCYEEEESLIPISQMIQLFNLSKQIHSGCEMASNKEERWQLSALMEGVDGRLSWTIYSMDALCSVSWNSLLSKMSTKTKLMSRERRKEPTTLKW